MRGLRRMLTKLVAAHMIREKIRGRMVILSSYVIREPQPNIALSSVLRIVTASLVRVLARDLGPKGIRVNGILPGYFMTKRIEELSRDAAERRGITPDQWIECAVHGGLGQVPAELGQQGAFLRPVGRDFFRRRPLDLFAHLR